MSIITLNTRSLPDSAVTTAKIAADAITDAKIADDVVGTEHLTAGEVDATALGADSVTAAKINNDIISGSTELASEPADTDEFLVSDAGTLKRIDYSLIKGGGITEADMWRVTTSLAGDADPIASNWERVDDASFNKIGTGMTESSGIFTFPSTGIYKVIFQRNIYANADDDRAPKCEIHVSSNSGSSYDTTGQSFGFIQSTQSSFTHNSMQTSTFVDVTDTSTFQVKFVVESINDSTTFTYGNSGLSLTWVEFLRLGDT